MSNSEIASKQVDDLLAELRADLGSGKKRGRPEPDAERKALNKAWHEKNVPLGKSAGKAPERLNPEDSEAWRPIAKETHIVIQECATCNDVTEFIGGEYVQFQSTHTFGGKIVRRAAQCPNLFLFDDLQEPLEERIDWHFQKVTRCSGCIRVELEAVALWEAHLRGQVQEAKQLPLLDITQPLPRKLVTDSSQEELHIEGLDS